MPLSCSIVLALRVCKCENVDGSDLMLAALVSWTSDQDGAWRNIDRFEFKLHHEIESAILKTIHIKLAGEIGCQDP